MGILIKNGIKIMSNQAQANKIFINGTTIDCTRKQIIEKIQRDLGVKPAYASTLYQNAKKQLTKTVTKNADKKLSATAHTPPAFTTAALRSTSTSTAEKITKIDRATLRMLRSEMNDAMADVMKKFGLEGNFGNISFTNTSFNAKFEVKVAGAKSMKDERKESAFQLYARSYGLKDSDLGRVFRTSSGKSFKITGLNTRARKNPIEATDVNTGKDYIFPIETVKRYLS